MDYPDLLEKLKNITRAPVQVQPAIVKAVDEAAFTVDVEFLSGALVSAVRLRAAIDDDPNAVVLLPKVGSSVLLGIIGNDTKQCFVAQCSVAEKVVGVIEDAEFELSKEKLHVKIDAAELLVEKNGNITLNDGSKDGLIIWNKLKADLEKFKQYLTAFDTALQTPVNEPGNGAPSAFQLALKGALAGKTMPNLLDSEIMNNKIKHGV